MTSLRSSGPVMADGSGILNSKARAPDPLMALATSSKTMPATSISVGDSGRSIGVTGRSGSPPNRVLTHSASALGSIMRISASGDEGDDATVMAWLSAPLGRASEKRASSTPVIST